MTDDAEVRLLMLQGAVEFLCANMIAHGKSKDEARDEAVKLSSRSLASLEELAGDSILKQKMGQMEAQFWAGVLTRLDDEA